MYNSQEIADKINIVAKIKNINVKKMLSDCDLGINLIYHLAKGQAISYLNLTKIADYLECSIDYLLGRVDDTNKYVNTKGTFSEDEEQIIYAYRSHKDLQKAVNKILDIDNKK